MSLALFVDGSVNPKTRIGFGAYLLLDRVDSELRSPQANAGIHTQCFSNTSSTQLELETLLWALAQCPTCTALRVYTDCQNIMGLLHRRGRLEANGFCNGRGVALAHKALYQSYYQQYDALGFELIKLKGHKPAAQRSNVDQWFSLVDRAARLACQQG